MKSKTKSILALSGTLVLGMVLGGLIASQVIRARIHNFRELRQKKNFTTRIIEVTGANAEQKAAIEPILDRFGQEMELMHDRHLNEVKATHEVLQDSLSKHLDQEQMLEIKREFRRMTGHARRMMRDKGDRPGRHPGHRHRKKNIEGGE